MSGLQDTLIATAVALPALLIIFWLVSIPMRDVSIVDVAWGVAIALAGWIAFGVGGGDDGRALLMVVLVTLWGGRLAGYIGLRKRRHRGEDSRYTAMRERSGGSFVRVSLGKVFLLQAALAWVIALALVGSATYDGELGWLDLAGVALWLVGICFEAGGDAIECVEIVDRAVRRRRTEGRYRKGGRYLDKSPTQADGSAHASPYRP